MKILIIEDEKAAATRLINQLKELKPGYSILDCIDSIEGAIEWFGQNPFPDLIFLDIQLSDGLSFNIFEKVKVNVPVIFTTAFDSYAIKAFELNSIDYLLKPINIEKLSQALFKFESTQGLLFSGASGNNIFAQLSNFIAGREPYKSRFLIPQHYGYLPILSNDIAYFHSESKNITITTQENKRYTYRDSLDNLEKELDPNIFWRANRAFIISDKAIVKAHNYFNYKIKLEIMPPPESDVIISRGRVGEFKQWYGK